MNAAAGAEARAGSQPVAPASESLAERIAPAIRGLTDLIPLAGSGRSEIAIRAPFNLERLGAVPHCTADDVQLAALRARAVQAAWAARPLSERRQVFLRYHDLVLDRMESLLDLVQIEGGKARRDALEEALDVALNARYYAQHAPELLNPRRRQAFVPWATLAWEYRHPVGLVSLISPWNYPLTMAVSDAIPALLAGNAVMLKPAGLTPFTALYAVRLLYEAGLPHDLFQVLTGPGSSLGAAMIECSDFIGFTGSTEVGRTIAEQAGRRLIKTSFELGGKNPLIVLDDADPDRAVKGAINGCFASAGQLCVAFERLYIQSGIYNRFVQAFVAGTKALKLGAALDYSVDVGTLMGQDQLDKAIRHVDDARANGAAVLTGGHARPEIGPYFFEPTILEGVPAGAECYREETFGPVVSLYRVDSVDDAIAAANDSQFGLNAAVFTRDERKGREVASRVRCGAVGVNESYAVSWASMGASMGGMKDSGLGRRHGVEGMHKYTESQNITLSRLTPIIQPFGIPMKLSAWLFPLLFRVMRNLPGLR